MPPKFSELPRLVTYGDAKARGRPLVLHGRRGATIFAFVLFAVMAAAAIWIYRNEGGYSRSPR
jgi:hypothetical protein